MPRRLRHEEPGAIHHVVPQGNGRRPFVHDDRDRHSYLSRFARVAHERRWEVHASSLLDTHHHAVVETPDADLGDGMRLVLGGHAAWVNKRHGRQGAVFAERFWSRRVYDDDLLQSCLYALLNPVAAGLVDHPRDWPWSSYATTVRRGCSRRLRALLGGIPQDATLGFLALVDEGAERIREQRLQEAAAVRLVARELSRRHMQGRG